MNLPLVILLTVLVHAAFNGSRLTVSLAAHSLHATPLTIGVLMSLYAAIPMLYSVTAGRFVDKVGAAKPMFWAAVAVGVGLLIGWLWHSIWALYVVALIVGTGFMVFHVAANSLVGGMGGEEGDENRSVRFSWFALGFSISGFIGPVFSGLAIDAVRHNATFGLLALGPALALGLMLLGVLKFPSVVKGKEAHRDKRVMDLVRDPQLRHLFVVTGLLSMGWDLFMFVMPIHGASLGLTASVIGGIMGAFAAATFTVRIVMPYVVKNVREWTMILIAFSVSTLAYLLMPFFTSVTLLAALAFLLGLGLGCAQPMVMTLLYEQSPVGRAGEALGVRSTVLNASHTGLPLLFGGVGAALGMMPVFLAMAALLGFGGWYAKTRRQKSSSAT